MADKDPDIPIGIMATDIDPRVYCEFWPPITVTVSKYECQYSGKLGGEKAALCRDPGLLMMGGIRPDNQLV